MRLKNLKTLYIYSPISTKIDGESTKKWVYKDTIKLNAQQDISQLDINSAGTIDYDRLKIRIDYDVNLEKNDGVSFKLLEIANNYTTEPPKYKVISNPKVGKVTTYTCEIYHGE